jgi:membrane-associated phospholipid phosphatase
MNSPTPSLDAADVLGPPSPVRQRRPSGVGGRGEGLGDGEGDDASHAHPLDGGDAGDSQNKGHQREPSKLDVRHPEAETAPRTQTSRRRRLLHALEELDQSVSSLIHSLPGGLPIEAVVIIPALAFSAYSIPAILFLSFLFMPTSFATVALAGCLLTLFLTSNLKHYTRRLRPGLHVTPGRRFNIRSWEKTNAMPSGDSAQAAMWLTLVSWRAGAPWPLLFIPLTQFGRTYFACHWVGDTIAGVCVGLSVAHLVLLVWTTLCAGSTVQYGLHQVCTV